MQIVCSAMMWIGISGSPPLPVSSSNTSLAMIGTFRRNASNVSAYVTSPGKSSEVATQTEASWSQAARTTIMR